MKKLKIVLAAAFLLVATACHSQHLLIGGLLQNCDSVKITAWSDGELIFGTTIGDKVYSIVLGAEPHYTIRFDSGTKHKYMHIINTASRPISYTVDIDFHRPEHQIMFNDTDNDRKAQMLIYKRSR